MKDKYKEKPVTTEFDGNQRLGADLIQNIINVRALMENSSDLIVKSGKIGQVEMCAMTCEGMTDKGVIANLIYRPLNNIGNETAIPLDELIERVQNEILIAEEQKQVFTYSELVKDLMSGFIIILINGMVYGISIGVQGYKSRSIDEPSTHINLRGSREGFVEVVRTNMSMVRRRMKSPTLRFDMMTMGERSKTDICVCYLTDKAEPSLVSEITERLKKVDLNTFLAGAYIQPFLENEGLSIFSEVGITERPDSFCAKLYDGRIGIIVDGTPFALVVPYLFVENFQTVDDYTQHPYYATFLRWLRGLSYILAVLLPGLYVALANFSPELFPNSLLLNLAASRQSTPYPLLTECLILYIMYEIMREAGLRLPKNIGHAVNIVGGLVIGEITVSVGLLGAPIMLVVAITGMCSFVVPDLYESSVLFRFAFIIAGGILGLFGITIVGALLLIKLTSKNSYGIPYLAPITPVTFKALRDVFVRISWKGMAKGDVTIQDLRGSREE